MPTTRYATCPHCGLTNDNRSRRAPSQDRNGTNPWHAQCDACRAARRRNRRAATPRVPATRLGDQRYFGVEIECVFPGGLSAARSALAMPSFEGMRWRVVSDGSLSSGGIEVVSPPLRGSAGMAQLEQMLQTLRDAGATVDRRCGLHVHHDVSDVGRVGAARFAESWHNNQSVLDWLVSPSRRGQNSYCEHLNTYEIECIRDWGRNGYHCSVDRYRVVNWQAFARHGTIEVRQHQGTLSFRKIEAWVRLAQGMLDAVARSRTPVTRHSNLRRLMDAVGLNEDTTAYLLGRAVTFGAQPLVVGVGGAAQVDTEVQV